MMEHESKVVSSKIIRCNNVSRNNLYDLLNIVPVQPTQKTANKINDDCGFLPKTDKIYVPKRKTGQKVKTIRDIRKILERDVYSYLPAELEKQRNALFRKIQYGFSRHDKTKELAKNILKSKSPISKSAWQMITNINPEDNKFRSQYILWNGKNIQVNGSRGGENKFIFNYDIRHVQNQRKYIPRSTTLIKKRQLLHHSLNIQFKPGPLSKKKYLDTSYQKYQFGELKLISLPKTSLEVKTSYGKPIAPLIDTFINKSFFENDGLITEKWAEFAVSVLGKNKNGIANEISEHSCVAFDLNYKCLQNRILMRHESDIINKRNINENVRTSTKQEDGSIIRSEVRKVIDCLLEAVEISLIQNDIYTGKDEPRVPKTDNVLKTNSHFNNKSKRKMELKRLDVTVITISETSKSDECTCGKDYCRLGCICDSLKCSYNLKRHCGLIDCMFICKCDFSKYKYMNSLDNNECTDIIPGLINLDKTLGQTLAKEEHKFHQTVILKDEKSIVLKSNKRNSKVSKKYDDFYSNLHLKCERNMSRALSIICPKLDCKNVEPWCMVHNLYKCFCKGAFTDTSLDEIRAMENENVISKTNVPASTYTTTSTTTTSTTTTSNTKALTTTTTTTLDNDSIKKGCEANNHTELVKENTTYNLRRQDSRRETFNDNNNFAKESLETSFYLTCARILPYSRRKYSNEYYKKFNNKILEMEKNDKKLLKKMISLTNPNDIRDENKKIKSHVNDDEIDITEHKQIQSDINNDEVIDVNKVNYIICDVDKQFSKEKNVDNSKHAVTLCNVMQKGLDVDKFSKCLTNETRLEKWFEINLKRYKELEKRGLIKNYLDAPKLGRLCLYSWEFILCRYRERKNYFLISKQKPGRTLIAIDKKKPCFNNCIDISDISLSDIDKYPDTVKHLITNATDLKDNYCILYGAPYCWMLIASAAKNVNQNILQEDNQTDQLMILEENSIQPYSSYESYNLEDLPIIIDDGTSQNFPIQGESSTRENLLINVESGTCENLSVVCKNSTSANVPMIVESDTLDNQLMSEKNNVATESKWFVMKIENDFTEIQFFKKGFFVRYESISKAIEVAKVTGKTVRLSIQKCFINKNNPQFGIYAIPNTEDSCVFIGPYEKDENLGIEAIKKVQNIETSIPQFHTRGIWVETNKVDNLKVIDNPLLFIPPSCLNNSKMVTVGSDSNIIYNTNEFIPNIQNKVPQPEKTTGTEIKQIKPIKIKKTNGFYQLTPNGSFKQIQSLENNLNNQSILNNSSANNLKDILANPSPRTNRRYTTKQTSNKVSRTVKNAKPMAEVAPLIKECSKNLPSSKEQDRKLESGMLVLKPEEINKRLFGKEMEGEQPHTSQEGDDDEMPLDIENFLATTLIRSAPSEEIFIISDEENDITPDQSSQTESNKDVWIVCKNIENLGWIAGKKNSESCLSFEFPGFKPSLYYPESEALKKISQILARKIYLPKHIDLQWQVLESKAEVKSIKKLDERRLFSDYILTERGLRHKFDVMPSLEDAESSSHSEILDEKIDVEGEKSFKKKARIMNDLEVTSKTLDDESSFLWNKAVSRRRQILETLSETTNDLRKELSEQLNSIISNTED